ncbi:MAG: sugar phosphate isomerase/epimerase family protein [Sphaerochaetaceae bacterium]
MAWPSVGVNLPKNCRFTALDETLALFEENGFDGVEINIETFPMIIEGLLCQPWVDAVKAVLERHQLFYTAHIGRGLNLRDMEKPELHRAVLSASLEICKQLNMSVLVLHYEVKSQDQKIEQQFLDAHRWAADLAGRLGVLLCVENIEVELVEPIVKLARQVNHPHLKLNLDTGHAFLAASYFHFDFLEAVSQMAPYLGHMHLNDNTGTFEPMRITNRPAYDTMTMNWRREFGKGDIHLPPFFGKVPFDEVFLRTRSYQGRYICEYTYLDYAPFNASVVRTVKEHLLASRTS